MSRTSSLKSINHSSSSLLFSPTPSPVHVPTPDSPHAPPSPSSPTNSLTSFCNTSSQHDDHLIYSVPPPQVRTSGHHPPSLNDPHALDKDKIYTIIQALCRQVRATLCVVVLTLSHLTPPLPYNNVICPESYNVYVALHKKYLK